MHTNALPYTSLAHAHQGIYSKAVYNRENICIWLALLGTPIMYNLANNYHFCMSLVYTTYSLVFGFTILTVFYICQDNALHGILAQTIAIVLDKPR